MKSLSDAARWVFLARQPKATHRAVRMALFPPAPPPPRRRRESIYRQGGRREIGREAKRELGREGEFGFARRTSVLAGDEVDVLPELDVEAGVAHEVL